MKKRWFQSNDNAAQWMTLVKRVAFGMMLISLVGVIAYALLFLLMYVM